MKPLALSLLFLVGCGDLRTDAPVEATTWEELWLNHGHPDACHGQMTYSPLGNGYWSCGAEHGVVTGRIEPDVVLTLSGSIRVYGTVRDYDGAIIADTDDGRHMVGYLHR